MLAHISYLEDKKIASEKKNKQKKVSDIVSLLIFIFFFSSEVIRLSRY